jgi:hypothetical protein
MPHSGWSLPAFGATSKRPICVDSRVDCQSDGGTSSSTRNCQRISGRHTVHVYLTNSLPGCRPAASAARDCTPIPGGNHSRPAIPERINRRRIRAHRYLMGSVISGMVLIGVLAGSVVIGVCVALCDASRWSGTTQRVRRFARGEKLPRGESDLISRGKDVGARWRDALRSR